MSTNLKRGESEDLHKVARMAEYLPDVIKLSKQMGKAQEEALDCLFGPSRDGLVGVTLKPGPLPLVRALVTEVERLRKEMEVVQNERSGQEANAKEQTEAGLQ